MRSTTRVLTRLAIVVAVIGSARGAGADPVPFITSGAYVIDGGRDFFTFIGAGINLRQTSGATPEKDFATTCSACMAGDTVNLSFRNPSSDPNGFVLFQELGTGHGTVGDE